MSGTHSPWQLYPRPPGKSMGESAVCACALGEELVLLPSPAIVRIRLLSRSSNSSNTASKAKIDSNWPQSHLQNFAIDLMYFSARLTSKFQALQLHRRACAIIQSQRLENVCLVSLAIQHDASGKLSHTTTNFLNSLPEKVPFAPLIAPDPSSF